MKLKNEPELYWPEHRVYFVATLALFPEKLLGHEVNQLFYKPYFVTENPDSIVLELEEYRKAGYLQYDKSGALYKITTVNSQKATNDLTKYLHQWRQDKLLSLPTNKPPDAALQKSLLLDAAARAYVSNKNDQRITQKYVYGESTNLEYEPKFWELVLSWQLLDNQVKITYMDYGRRIDGLYDDDAQPLIDFTITDNKLENEMKRLVTIKEKTNNPTTSPDIVPALQGRVDKDGRQILITIIGDDTYVIKRLGEDGTYDKFMDYVMHKKNADIDINIQEINAITGLQAVSNLSLLVRYSGFIKPFKKAFFTTSKKEKIRFRRVAQLSNDQVEAIKKQAKKV